MPGKQSGARCSLRRSWAGHPAGQLLLHAVPAGLPVALASPSTHASPESHLDAPRLLQALEAPLILLQHAQQAPADLLWQGAGAQAAHCSPAGKGEKRG